MTPLPPKQGLKLEKYARLITYRYGYDTTSTKTRIETTSVGGVVVKLTPL